MKSFSCLHLLTVLDFLFHIIISPFSSPLATKFVLTADQLTVVTLSCHERWHITATTTSTTCTPLATDLLPEARWLHLLTSGVNNTTWNQTHTLICTAPRCYIIVFKNSMTTSFVYTSMVLGQHTGLSKGVCLLSGCWLVKSIDLSVQGWQEDNYHKTSTYSGDSIGEWNKLPPPLPPQKKKKKQPTNNNNKQPNKQTKTQHIHQPILLYLIY